MFHFTVVMLSSLWCMASGLQ